MGTRMNGWIDGSASLRFFIELSVEVKMLHLLQGREDPGILIFLFVWGKLFLVLLTFFFFGL
jgi:hypothetical protein